MLGFRGLQAVEVGLLGSIICSALPVNHVGFLNQVRPLAGNVVEVAVFRDSWERPIDRIRIDLEEQSPSLQPYRIEYPDSSIPTVCLAVLPI